MTVIIWTKAHLYYFLKTIITTIIGKGSWLSLVMSKKKNNEDPGSQYQLPAESTGIYQKERPVQPKNQACSVLNFWIGRKGPSKISPTPTLLSPSRHSHFSQLLIDSNFQHYYNSFAYSAWEACYARESWQHAKNATRPTPKPDLKRNGTSGGATLRWVEISQNY
jgi:hypothetical protein